MSAEMKEVEEFVRQYFIDDDKASINDCVRDGLDLRIPVNPGLVSNIRRRMRQEMSNGKPKLVVVPPLPTKAQAKTWLDKWPADKPPPVVVNVPEPVEPKEEKQKFATVAERRKYYDDILLEDPMQTVVAAMKKVKAKFGRSVDPGYAVASLKAVRDLVAGASKPVPVAPPPPTPAPKEPPVSKEENDEYAIIFFPSTGIKAHETILTTKNGVQQKLMELSAKGIDAQNIRVFKQVKVKLKVTVDFGD